MKGRSRHHRRARSGPRSIACQAAIAQPVSIQRVDSWGPVQVPELVDARFVEKWYGRYLDPDWRKWTIDEARAMFSGVGLTSPTWDLPSAGGRFRVGPRSCRQGLVLRHSPVSGRIAARGG